jgi:3-hydroxy-9,10-secoandrosta-1,3,5(10)-triene-9,17-dione monooxygenase
MHAKAGNVEVDIGVSASADGKARSEELIRRARKLRGLLEEKAGEADELRQLAPDVVDALAEAELLSLGTPAAFGGQGVDHDTMLEVTYELGRGCASTAWVWMIWTLHSWFLGLGTPEARDELYANGPSPIISSGYNPAGSVVEKVDGGILLSGKWAFSSGVDYAHWLLLGAVVPGLERPLGALNLLVFVPREKARIIDDWYVLGLKATGSKSVVIEDPVFVPEHLFLDQYQAELGPAKSLFGLASYGLPSAISMGFIPAAPFIGAARSVLDAFCAEMKSKRDSLSGVSKADSVSLQMRIGEAAAEVDVALTLARAEQHELLDLGREGRVLTPEQRASFRLHQVFCVELSRRSVTRLVDISGTAANWSSAPIVRKFCDIHAGSKHFSHRWDEYTESYGRVRVGLDANALQS